VDCCVINFCFALLFFRQEWEGANLFEMARAISRPLASVHPSDRAGSFGWLVVEDLAPPGNACANVAFASLLSR